MNNSMTDTERLALLIGATSIVARASSDDREPWLHADITVHNTALQRLAEEFPGASTRHIASHETETGRAYSMTDIVTDGVTLRLFSRDDSDRVDLYPGNHQPIPVVNDEDADDRQDIGGEAG